MVRRVARPALVSEVRMASRSSSASVTKTEAVCNRVRNRQAKGRGRPVPSPRPLETLERRVLLTGSVVINEIHYHPDVKTEAVEFVEITNPGDAPVDLSGAA